MKLPGDSGGNSAEGDLPMLVLGLEELRADVRSCRHFMAPSIWEVVPTSSTALTDAVTVMWLEAEETKILHPVHVWEKKEMRRRRE